MKKKMRSTCKKIAVFLFCFSLTTPVLYGQNEAIPLTIITLPGKKQLNTPILLNIPPILEQTPQAPTPSPESSDKETTKNISASKVFSPAYLIPTRQSFAFTQSYRKDNKVFLDFIDKKVYEATLEKTSEKKILREQWEIFFGIDIWYPYFKAKEVEDWISDKTKVQLFHFKGRMRFENNQIRYTFKTQF